MLTVLMRVLQLRWLGVTFSLAAAEFLVPLEALSGLMVPRLQVNICRDSRFDEHIGESSSLVHLVRGVMLTHSGHHRPSESCWSMRLGITPPWPLCICVQIVLRDWKKSRQAAICRTECSRTHCCLSLSLPVWMDAGMAYDKDPIGSRADWSSGLARRLFGASRMFLISLMRRRRCIATSA